MPWTPPTPTRWPPPRRAPPWSTTASTRAAATAGYRELGDALEETDRGLPRDDHAARFRALARSLARWAFAHPHDWALLFGSPVPGYVAPEDTVPHARRTTGAFLTVLQDAVAAEALEHAAWRPGAEVAANVAPLVAETGGEMPASALALGTAAWSAVMGAVSLAVFGHTVGSVQTNEEFVAGVADAQCTLLGW